MNHLADVDEKKDLGIEAYFQSKDLDNGQEKRWCLHWMILAELQECSQIKFSDNRVSRRGLQLPYCCKVIRK